MFSTEKVLMQPVDIHHFEKIPLVSIKGKTAYERGLSQGQQLKDRIRATIQVYLNIFAQKNASLKFLKQFSKDMRSYIRKSYPWVDEELQGIAKSSDTELWKLYLLNSRTEIMNLLNVQYRNCNTFTQIKCEEMILQPLTHEQTDSAIHGFLGIFLPLI
ncbi:hypothetical protein RFI_30875 [Reticulomyxa filosa]|uniref:Uncharacterized protein n=1 Tax=Reticulomyxa filosa TaxID=46433 RepID=X6LY30_RETFI|nr:hypothetical protein RFI_30875 [Reticulomyxa filosa]|eukprot:ETO06514.1 hypothetical protein RFI_30875 [Reticulomyxa filosa]